MAELPDNAASATTAWPDTRRASLAVTSLPIVTRPLATTETSPPSLVADSGPALAIPLASTSPGSMTTLLASALSVASTTTPFTTWAVNDPEVPTLSKSAIGALADDPTSRTELPEIAPFALTLAVANVVPA
jgi:hypothetical protein